MSLVVALAVVILAGKATSKYCDGDYYCTPPKECCTLGCCYLYSQPTPNLFNLVIWNHWYLWCVIVIGVCVCCGVCGCGLWRRKSRGGATSHQGGSVGRRGTRGTHGGGDASSELDSMSAGSCYQAPPHYSRCSSFQHPPPYNEVTSKPDLYPLVISYSDTGKTSGMGGGAGGGSYLMVHYFRNYIMRPVGSLSAASTADSLSSSLFCNAANEANSLVPPPYSSAPGSVDQINLHSSPLHQVLSQSESHGVGVGGGVGGMMGVAGGGGSELSNVSSVIGPLGAASPPQATTPTLQHTQQQQQQLIYKINQLPPNQAGSSGRLKLSLSRGCRHWLSRSAPSTPSTRLAPLPFPSQESSPLLLTNNNEEEDDDNEQRETAANNVNMNNDNDSIF